MSIVVREATEEDRVAEAVARCCAAGHAGEGIDLIAAQTVEPTPITHIAREPEGRLRRLCGWGRGPKV